ncbi:MAG: hypothetical protein JWM11_6982 [Planctomycetaceae bacterium]|nr:hypothetical protein [Planctomycetaceae bacterium]
MWTVLICITSSGTGFGAAPDYVKEIKPLLQRRCVNCHGALKQKGNLRLDVRSAILKGGDSGPSVEPGKADQSLLLHAVAGTNGVQRMPLEGEPLKPEEIQLLKTWIDAGAVAPDEPLPPDPRQHWAFQKPTRTALPAVSGAEWKQNPIDAFISAEHQKRGLVPRPEATKPVLLRRIFLDLIGVPPTRQEMQAFLGDVAPDAYEKVVDRLLASPQYGERWARHWMDVWRYSDWDGYGAEVRESQAHIWRWRDWIVESLNSDHGYDRMVQEMLAADELYPDDSSRLRATGFLVRNYFRFNRNVWMDNTVEHTGKAFMGLTWNCARCHDHMYDPISQQEYYQLRAIFEPYDVRTDRVANQSDVTKDGLARVYDAHAATPTFLFVRGDEKEPVKEKPLTPLIPGVLGAPLTAVGEVVLPARAYYPGMQKFVHDESQAQALAEVKRTEALAAVSMEALAAAKQKLSVFQNTTATPTTEVPPILADNFAAARPELWKQSHGKWEYQNGKLLQLEPLDQSCELISQIALPQDFQVRFRFKTTGGKMWKSVGLSFDAVGETDSAGVYLSSYAGGPRVQIVVKTQGQSAYPADASKPLTVALGEEHELQVFVRGLLVNVAVDGKLHLAYKLPRPRPASNEFRLWTYDATAEFLDVRVTALAPETAVVGMIQGDQPAPIPMPLSLESLTANIQKAEQGVVLAVKTKAVSIAELDSVKARVDADDAQYSNPIATNAKELAQAAVKCERELVLKQAELKQYQAEQATSQAKLALKPGDEKLQKAVTDAEAKLAESTKACDAAKLAHTQPLTENYSRFGTVYPMKSTGRRLAFARWIASPENPLTARVAINHMWLRHFGSPLVPTVFDFGLNGKLPTHPGLLDWLAVELMQSQWQMKSLHRLMVTSRAYRAQSHGLPADEPNSKIDPENLFLWRANPHRMEAETIRDSTLAVCEQLDRTTGGPDLDPQLGLTIPRRSLYFRSAKEKKVTFLAMFDSANVVECYRRSESIVPQQALAMANSPLTLVQARLLAQKLSQEAGLEATPEANMKFIEIGFLQVLARPASQAEIQECQTFLASQGQRFSAVKELTAFGAGPDTLVKPSTVPHLRARENLIHVLLNHNEFVTVR